MSEYDISDYKVITIKIDIMDEKTYEIFLEKYKKINQSENIVCVIQTYGSLNFTANKIGEILMKHSGNVIAFIPHYAYSGGTIIALSCRSIIMGKNSVMSPCDAQINTDLLENKEIKKFKKKYNKEDKEFLEKLVHHHDYSILTKKRIIENFYKPSHDSKLTYDKIKDIGLNISCVQDIPSKLAKYFKKLEHYLSLI